jgi:predicted enzyme related to lactoylglutathione lyase
MFEALAQEDGMANVIGVGGVFFKSDDPEGLMTWYRDVLGMTVNDYGGADFLHADSGRAFPQGARTIFSAFKDTTEYFAPSASPFMINLMIDDMDGMLARLAEKGVPLEGEPQDFDYGRFAWVMDPNGVKIELWQPVEPAA